MSRQQPIEQKKVNRPGQFQPGHKINVKENTARGRFITRQLIALLNEEMDDPDFDKKDKERVRQRAKVVYFLCKKLIKMALAGDSTAIKLVMDRVEGTAINTTMYREIPDGAETPSQLQAMQLTRERIAAMTPDERIGLYRSALTEAGRTVGSA